jgi:hypothetical protein
MTLLNAQAVFYLATAALAALRMTSRSSPSARRAQRMSAPSTRSEA